MGNLGFAVAMATSVTTGLFGVFLLCVYGRLGKLNKLFKKRYPFCVPLCDAMRRCHCFADDENDDDADSAQSANSKEKSAKTECDASFATKETKTRDGDGRVPPTLEVMSSTENAIANGAMPRPTSSA